MFFLKNTKTLLSVSKTESSVLLSNHRFSFKLYYTGNSKINTEEYDEWINFSGAFVSFHSFILYLSKVAVFQSESFLHEKGLPYYRKAFSSISYKVSEVVFPCM